MAAQLPTLPTVERLSPRVLRILGGNPGKVLTLWPCTFDAKWPGTNTYLIGRGPSRYLLDTGQGEASWHTALTRTLATERARIDTVLLSHWHVDHVSGVSQLEAGMRVHKHTPTLHAPSGSKWEGIEDGQTFRVEEGTTLRAVHTPGHTVDHIAFVLEEEDALFTGDNLLGHGTAVFEDLGAYLKSLEVMRGVFGGRAYPGHGAVVEEGKKKVEEYIAHRKERERQVLEVLTADERKELSSMDIVKVVYKDVPEQLHIPAEGGVKQVLWKMKVDGRVTSDNDGAMWRISEKGSL